MLNTTMIPRFLFRNYLGIWCALFIAISLFFTSSVSAAHSCGSCCAGSSRTCLGTAGPYCSGGGCWDGPATCPVGNPTGLTYTCNAAGTSSTLSWTAGVNNLNPYYFRVDNVVNGWPLAGDVYNDSYSGTSYVLATVPSNAYNWWIHGQNLCADDVSANDNPNYLDYSSGAFGAQISCPQIDATSPVILGGTGGDASCTGTGCNSKDAITQIDTGNNQQIRVEARFDDPGPLQGAFKSDFTSADIFFDSDNNRANGYDLGIRYTDSGNGSPTVVVNGGTYSAAFVAGSGTYDASTVYGTGRQLKVYATINLAALGQSVGFSSNIYTQATDIPGKTVGPTLQASSIYMWNGKDVKITGNFYDLGALDPSVLCTTTRGGLTPLSSNAVTMTASYTGGTNDGPWPASVTTWYSNGPYQPFNHYKGTSTYTVNYTLSPTATYFLEKMDAQRYGGGCYTAVMGNQITGARFRDRENGVANFNSSYPNAAFGLRQISSSWSRTVDGSYFVNGNIGTTIQTTTCPAGANCSFSDKTNSTVNGLVIANGTITTGIKNQAGDPNNWYAEGLTSATLPFNQINELDYDQIKALYKAGEYTELTGDQLLPASLEKNKVYFIDGNLTVNGNYTIATTEYNLFFVSGNLIVNKDVSTLHGIFIVQGTATISGETDINHNPNDTSKQFTFQGALSAKGAITVSRTLGAANNYNPSVIMTYRPDMVALLPVSGLITKQRIYLGEN